MIGEFKRRREFERERGICTLLVPEYPQFCPEHNYSLSPPGSLHTQTHCREGAWWKVLVLKQKVKLCWWKLNRHTHLHMHLIHYLRMLIKYPLPSGQSTITLNKLINTSQQQWYTLCKRTQKSWLNEHKSSWDLTTHDDSWVTARPDQRRTQLIESFSNILLLNGLFNNPHKHVNWPQQHNCEHCIFYPWFTSTALLGCFSMKG